jgi:hypothetical protein
MVRLACRGSALRIVEALRNHLCLGGLGGWQPSWILTTKRIEHSCVSPHRQFERFSSGLSREASEAPRESWRCDRRSRAIPTNWPAPTSRH